MNDKDLIYFCKLIESGSYTFTADYFQVTQPTISMAIKRLSARFNDPLIIQKNRKSKIKLTPAGELLYKKAQFLLREIASMDYDVRHASDRRIRIAFSGEAGSIFIPEIINDFYQAGIINLLDTKIERSATAFAGLTNGDVDVAIYSWMLPINDPDYYIRNLEKTELVIITGLEDQWIDKTEVTAYDLRNRKFIARQDGYLTRECLKEEARLGNFTPKIIYTAPTMKLMIDLVKRNIGIALAMESSLSVHDKKSLHIIKMTEGQKLWAYMQIAMRKSFIPNHYQQKGIELLRKFHLNNPS